MMLPSPHSRGEYHPQEGTMHELLFIVDESPEGGYIARAVDQSICTEADDLETLKARVREAVCCHFDEGCEPDRVRLRFVGKDEIEL